MRDNLPRWIDFHCHLDLYPDHEALLKACERDKIATLAITTTPKAWKRNREMASGQFVQVSLGLHPQLVAERANEIALWETLLPKTRFVGEVGLDAGPRFYASFDQQKSIFERVLKACAVASGKILSVHSVRCASTVLDMIDDHLPAGRGTVVLHWFSGSKSEARRAEAMGCYFSVNAGMLRSPRGKEIVAMLPSERILTETDGPFGLIEDRPARPTDIPSLVRELATFRMMSNSDLAAQLVSNWQKLVGYPSDWPKG
jgi:TatD DNase family protein